MKVYRQSTIPMMTKYTYFAGPDNDNLLVMKFDSDNDENVEILNIEIDVTYILPSPHKIRSSRKKNIQIKLTQNTVIDEPTFF